MSPLAFNLYKTSETALVCMKLHNACIRGRVYENELLYSTTAGSYGNGLFELDGRSEGPNDGVVQD